MRPRGVVAWFAAVFLALQSLAPLAAAPPAAPVCHGQDLVPELAAKDPAALERIDRAAKTIVNAEAVLWRVSRPGVAPSHLLGTIHLSDERVTALSPRVTTALAAARRVALEVADVSPKAFMAALGRLRSRFLFEDGRSLGALLEPHELATAGAALTKAGFPEPVQVRLRPWFVTLMLAMSDCERARAQAGRLALDLEIAARAAELGVPLVGLETLDDQLGVMASVPEADQLTVLKATLKSHARTADLVETMLQRYLARDMARMLPLQAELIRAAGLDPAGFKSFQHALLTVRNPRMRDAALPMLSEGGAFIAVGALHLIGDDGLVALLRTAGYELTPVE